MMMNNFYVYRYIRLDNNTPFYVGKGKGYRASRIESHNKYCKNIAKKFGYIVEYIIENISENLAFAKEAEFISLYKSLGYCEANFSSGGEGASGIVVSEETRKKLSKSGKIAQNRPEVKAKISKASKKIQNTPEAKAKRSEISKEIWKDSIIREKIQNSLKEIWKDEKYKSEKLKTLHETGLEARKKPFSVYIAEGKRGNIIKGKFVNTYYNKITCAKDLGICYKNMAAALSGKYKQHKGYIFEYRDKEKN